LIRLLLDQGLPRSAAEALRRLGSDVVHVGETGLSAATDSQILEHARQAGRVVCTLDADFHALLALSGASGPSVVRIRREGLRGDALASLMAAVLPQLTPALEKGAMVSITENALRIRYLPLTSS
jgi:predicted nuclease of predicted toxin-antitoxin system